MSILDQKPSFTFNWEKQGVAGITPLGAGMMLIIVRDETDKTFTMKKIERYGDINVTSFTAENMAYFTDIFTYPISELYIYRLGLQDLIDVNVQNNILGTVFDYGVFPDADATDYTALISMVRAGRTEFKSLKWILPTQQTNPDQPYFIQFEMESPAKADGTTITTSEYLNTFTAQRTAKVLTESLTYDIVGNVASFVQDSDVNGKLAAGIIVPIKKNNKIVYARDINSLVTLGDKYDARFRENQRFETMDTITRDIKFTWDTRYVGNYQNSGDNKRAFIAVINRYIKDRAKNSTDPVQDGLFYIDWEEHREILRAAGYTEKQIKAMDISELEDIDTSTFVYINGQVQINGVMEDIRFNVTLATTVIPPTELS